MDGEEPSGSGGGGGGGGGGTEEKKEEDKEEEKKKKEEIPCAVPTINFKDFVSLVSPSAVSTCLTCSTPLVSNSPPSLAPHKKGAVLKIFCDVLNLPFSLGGGEEDKEKEKGEVEGGNNDVDDEDDEGDKEDNVDFPFCFQCTKDKVLLLTMLYEKLQILQEQFERLKDAVMKDILRAFVTNILMDKKIPVEGLRETRICEKMFKMFKRHTERTKPKDTLENEVQTDISSVSTPLMTPAAVANILEGQTRGGSGVNERKRRIGNRRTESHTSSSSKKHFTFNSPAQKYKSSSSSLSYQDSNSMPAPQQQTVIEESVVPFDENMGKDMFPFDGNFGETSTSNHTNYSKTNGYSTIDEELQNSLGLAAGGYQSSSSLHIPNNSVARSSPVTYTNLDYTEVPQSETDVGKTKKLVICNLCGKTIRKDTFNAHMNTVHSEPTRQCRGCDKKFSRTDGMLSHEASIHIVNSKREYFCHRCVESVKIVASKSAYVNHCVDHHEVEDDVVEFFHFCDFDNCNESYKIHDDFVDHVKTHWGLGDSFVCKNCQKVFASAQRFAQHELEAHREGIQYFDCKFCHKGFHDEEDFTSHLAFHRVKIPAELPFECDICKKCFETLTLLRRHTYKVHRRGSVSDLGLNDGDLFDDDSRSSKNDFQCEDCGKSYTSEKKFKKHCKRHQQSGRKSRKGESESEDDVPDAGALDDDEEDEDYGASKTKRRKPSRRKSTGKAKQEQPEQNQQPDLDEKQKGGQVCIYCKKSWKTRLELRRHHANYHRKEHFKNGKVFCIVCFHVFDSAQELDDHCTEKHSKFRCKICQKQLQNATVLKHHITQRHKANKFVCSICNCGFSKEHSLKRHMTKDHPDRDASPDSHSNDLQHNYNEASNNSEIDYNNSWNFSLEEEVYEPNMMDFF